MCLAQIDLTFLPVGGKSPVAAPHRNTRKHSAIAFVAPIHGQLSGRAIREIERAIHFIFHIPREDTFQDDSRDRSRRAHYEVDQIDGVTAVIV
jgi:hypothetical protein